MAFTGDKDFAGNGEAPLIDDPQLGFFGAGDVELAGPS